MYKISKLPPPVPYAHSGRVWKKPETSKYYDLIKEKIKSPPECLQEWEPGIFVRLTVQFIFSTKSHGDPENYNKALVNGITQAIQKFYPKFDDQWIGISHKRPLYGKKDTVIFELDIPPEGEW